MNIFILGTRKFYQELSTKYRKFHTYTVINDVLPPRTQGEIRGGARMSSIKLQRGPCRDRTDDPQIKSLLLYRLS